MLPTRSLTMSDFSQTPSYIHRNSSGQFNYTISIELHDRSFTVAVRGCLLAAVYICVATHTNHIDNWYSYGYSDGNDRDCEQYAKLACNFLMQWNLGRSIAIAEKKTATHTFWTCGQFSEFHIFHASKCTRAQVTPGTHARFCPPPPPPPPPTDL